MKVAILTPTFYGFSGIDRLVERQAEEYAKKGDKVTIIAFKGDIDTKHAEVIYIGAPGSPTLERLYRLLFFLDVKKIRRYGSILKGYGMAISHFYPMNWIAGYAKKNHKVRFIYNHAGVAFPRLFSPAERIYMRLFRWLNHRSIRSADEIISISNFLAKELKEYGFDSRVEHCKIDIKRFNENIDGEPIRKRYGIKNSPLLLYVGRISPHKGIHLLLESFSYIKEKFKDAKLMIVGKHTFKGYSKKLQEKIDDSVIITGFVSDEELPGYYAACDVYTTATLWEGFDLPAAEAQACGRPVVAYDLCAHPEVVKHGRLVKPRDTKAFADAVIKILISSKRP